MASIKPFEADDLYELNPINVDPLTENFGVSFYLDYAVQWPQLFFKSTERVSDFGKTSVTSGYMMGKAEGRYDSKDWHTHITAVTVQDTYRRIGHALRLCLHLERLTGSLPFSTYFIDLFVKVTNTLARQLYEKLGYSVYRRVVGYYGGSMPTDRNALDDDIDAFDMRKALPMDTARELVRENGEKFYVLPQEVQF